MCYGSGRLIDGRELRCRSKEEEETKEEDKEMQKKISSRVGEKASFTSGS